MAYGRYFKAYKKTDLDAEMSVADPHRITQMLYEGLIDRLSQAKGAIERKDFKLKAEKISKALGIVNGLQMSLDPNVDKNLYDPINNLYEHIKFLLNEASTGLEIEPIDRAIALITPVKEAWDNIPEEEKNKVNAIIKKKLGLPE